MPILDKDYYAIVNDELFPTWVSCFEKLTNDGMKPSELVRHLKSRHPEHEDKSLQFFQRCFKPCDIQSTTL